MTRSSCETINQNVGKDLFKTEIIYIGDKEACLLMWKWNPSHPFGPSWQLVSSFCVPVKYKS